MQSVTTVLDIIQAAPADRTAVILPDTGAHVTYGCLRDQVLRMADCLSVAGIRPGSRVAISLQNGLAAIVTFLAASIAGTAAPMNPTYKRQEFTFYLEDTGARVLIYDRRDKITEAGAAAAHLGIPILPVDVDANGNVELCGISPKPWTDAPGADNVALILHTSGSTGRPKRVPLRHRNLAHSATSVAQTYGLSPDDVSLCFMPLFHVHGIVASTLAPLLSGGTVVAPNGVNPLNFWRYVRQYGVTWYTAVPTIHHVVAARARSNERPQEGTLRFVRSASAPLAPEMMRKMEQVFGVPVLEAYGMTEAAHQMASNPLPPAVRKAGSVGLPTGLQVSIMDACGNHLPEGARGEIVIQGPNVFSGYENDAEANALAFTHGWFRTGDEGWKDADGYIHISGRIKELINRAGEKVAPRHVDEVLAEHPAVAEAVAFGMPHPTLGEEVAAAVVLREGYSESDLMKFCRERLAHFECPKKIFVVESIPRTATGKIQRRLVAQALCGNKDSKEHVA